MNEKLKPCPFCGGEAEVQCAHDAAFKAVHPESDNAFWWVTCSQCGAGSFYADTPEQAAELWNTRDTFSRKVVRVLRRLLIRTAVKVLAKCGEKGTHD